MDGEAAWRNRPPVQRIYALDAKMTGNDDRARSLALFASVVEEGSFSAAGRTLGLTPSAVARAIDRIEARLGVRLLLRSTRALTLTAEGQAYLLAARRILADLDDAEQQIADQGAPRGRLRISAALAHGRLCVVPLLGAFLREYPNILVDISLTDLLVDVAGGQADVAIRFGPLADSTLTARKLGETRRVIVASPAYLARHGVTVRTECLPAQARAIGDEILQRAERAQADLIVAGAYGHTRMREWIFGGVTRTLLQHSPIACLLSH